MKDNFFEQQAIVSSEVFLPNKSCVQKNLFQSSSSKPASIWFRISAAAERPIALQVSGVWPNFSALFLAEWKAVEVALWRKVDFLSHQKFGLKRIFVTCEIALKHMCCHHNNDCDAEELAAQRLLCSSFDFSFHLLFLLTFLCCFWLRFCLGLGPHRKSSCFFPLIQKYSKHLLLKNATNLSSVVSLLFFPLLFLFRLLLPQI